MKPLKEYISLCDVPLEHPEVKFRCKDPRVYCGDACGNVGCLGIDKEECKLRIEK